jgi:hypothetical protein
MDVELASQGPPKAAHRARNSLQQDYGAILERALIKLIGRLPQDTLCTFNNLQISHWN